MNADARPRSGRRGERLLLDDIRCLDTLLAEPPASARERLRYAVGPEFAQLLVAALTRRRDYVLSA